MKKLILLLLFFGAFYLQSCVEQNTPSANQDEIEANINEEPAGEVEPLGEVEPANEVEPKGEVEPEGEVEPTDEIGH